MLIFMKKHEKAVIETFGKNVRSIRKSLKMTSDDLAEKAGISYTWVSEIENFHAKGVSLDIAFRIAKALDTTLDSLLEEEINIDRAIEQLKRAAEAKNRKTA